MVRARGAASALSDWEVAERRALMEHAERLVARGASVADAAEACDVDYERLRKRMVRRGRRTAPPTWSAEEDARLAAALAECASWREVTAMVGTRDEASCRGRAHRRGWRLASGRGAA